MKQIYSKPYFDSETIKRFYGDSNSDIINILEEYLSKKDEMLHSLYTSYKLSKEDLCNSLHFHSSVFTYVGFPQLSRDCVAFQQQCKIDIDNTVFKENFDSLIGIIRESTTIVKQEIDKLAYNTY